MYGKLNLPAGTKCEYCDEWAFVYDECLECDEQLIEEGKPIPVCEGHFLAGIYCNDHAYLDYDIL